MNLPAVEDSIVDDGACFACGPSADGLSMRFTRANEGDVRAEVILDARFQGYRGIAHGGIVMMLLDEAMAHAAGVAGVKVRPAAVAVRFRAAVRLGVPLEVTAQVDSMRGKVLKVSAAVLDAAGAILATGDGSFVSLGPVEPGRFGNLGPEPAV